MSIDFAHPVAHEGNTRGDIPRITAIARVRRALVLYSRKTPRLSSRNTTRFLLTPTIFTSLLFPGALHRHVIGN